MNKILVLLALSMSLVGFAGALGFENGVEMRPGEAAAEARFEHGFGSAWAGGDPPQRPAFGPSLPHISSISRPGFPVTGYRYWAGVQISPFRACYPFCDGDGQFYYSRSYFYGWRFQSS
jgi:hypothetical protein